MDDYSQETLRKIEQDDLIQLGICNKDDILSRTKGRFFTSSDGDDYSRLGSCIGNNTNLKTLYVELGCIGSLQTDSGFFEGIKQNSSIQTFMLSGWPRSPVGDVGCKLLKVFQENSSHLTTIHIWCCDIRSAAERVIINTALSICRNLKTINFNHNYMTDEQLLPMVEAIRGHRSLEELSLHSNRIGNAGCEALSTLLEDPNCNLHTLDVQTNQVGNEGATAIINSLSDNNKLKKLNLITNEFVDHDSARNAFIGLLCKTSSINDIHSSNHTLLQLFGGQEWRMRDELASLLKLNKGSNKSHVAIIKILKYHPNIETEPLFEWGSNDERNLMALPYVVAWFDRAKEAVEDIDRGDDYRVDYYFQFEAWEVEEKKLTAIYEFALAMPVLFIPTSDKKRKRVS